MLFWGCLVRKSIRKVTPTHAKLQLHVRVLTPLQKGSTWADTFFISIHRERTIKYVPPGFTIQWDISLKKNSALKTYFQEECVQYSDRRISQDFWKPIRIELLHLAVGIASGFNLCSTLYLMASPYLWLWLFKGTDHQREQSCLYCGVSWHFLFGPPPPPPGLWKT